MQFLMWQVEWYFQGGYLEWEVSLRSKKADLHLTIPKLTIFKQTAWKKKFKPRETTHNLDYNLKYELHLSLAWPTELYDNRTIKDIEIKEKKQKTKKKLLMKLAVGGRKQKEIILVFQEGETGFDQNSINH